MADNSYKIELGVKLNTTDLAEQIGKLDNKHKIKLGVDLGVEDIRKRISAYNENTNNAKLKLKIKLDTSDLKKQIGDIDLSAKGKGLAVPVDTKSLENSLKEVSTIIKDIRNSLGTIDDKSDMKSLVASINQIATALEKATNESDGLVASLNALSKKDFSVNFGLNMGSSNPIGRNVAYGNKVRNETLPQLKKQVESLVKYYNEAYKESADEFMALTKLASKANLGDGNFFNTFLYGDNSVASRMSSGSLASQMQAYKEYIDMFKKAASLSGLDLTTVTSQFSKTTDALIKDAQDIQTGANEMQNGFEKIKSLFSGGIDSEGLSVSLEPIITNLNEIKTAVQELSKVKPFDGLTASFDRLSGSIENLLANAEKVRGVLGSGLDSIDSGSASTVRVTESTPIKTAQQTGQKIGETITKSTQQSLNIDDVIDKEVLALMDKFGITGDKSSEAFTEIKQAVIECRAELTKIKNSDIGIDEEVFDTSRAVDKVTNAIANQYRAVNNLGDEYVKLAEKIEETNKREKGYKIQIPEFVKQEQGDDYRANRGSLGAAFTTGKGTSFADFIDQINNELGQTIDLTKGEAEAFDELLRKVEIGKQQKKALEQSDKYRTSTASTEEILEQNGINREEISNDARAIVNIIDAAEQQIAQSSTQITTAVSQDEEKKRQEYRETAKVYEKVSRDTSLVRDDVSFRERFEVTNQAAQEAQRHFQELLAEEKAVVSITEQFDNSNALQSFAVNVKRASGEVETLRYAMVNLADKEAGEDDDWVFRYQGASSSDKGVERQLESHIKKANDLQIQLDKIKSRYSDMGHAKPIKDADHIESLNAQYKKVEAAIESVRNADNATFSSMVSNAERERTALENMEREFRNAENVSSSLKGTDLTSGIEIAKNNLEKFKAQAKDFPQITQTVNDLDEAITSVGDKSSLDSFTDQLKVARAELAKVKAETIAANRKEKVGINVSGATSRIADIQRISPEINEFKTVIDGAEVSVESLLKDLSEVNTAGDFSVVNSKLRAFEDAAKAAGIAVTETVTKASSITKIKDKLQDTGFNGFEQEVARAHAEAKKLEGVYDNLENALRELDIAMANVSSADQANDTKRLVAANEEYENSLKKVYSQLKLYQQAEKQAFDTEMLNQKKASLNSEMEIWLKENSRAAKDFGEEIRILQTSLDGLDDNGLKLAGQQFKTLTKQAQAMGKTGLTVFDKLKLKVKEYMAYLSAAEMFMYAEQALRSMFEQVKLIDAAMTELKKVTNETDEAYDKFLSNAADRAREIGTTIDGLVKSTADFARLGYGFEDAQELAEVANIYAVVGDEIEGVEGATESLISTMAAFKDEMNGMSNSDFAMSIIDKFNEIGNNFAISSGGIGDALERSASSLMAANNTIDESIALITAANTVVQDPAAVGTAFKTISMRIRGAKTELEEAGLETDGMVESTAKLRSEILALTGVDIMDGANQFKSTYKIMDELAVKWKDLTDIQQATVTELIAGKRQGNIVSSLMTNFDTARDALDTSLNSAGSAMKEHEKWQQSLEAQILSLKASWQSLSQAFLSSDFLKTVLNGVINLADGLTKLIDTFGAFPTLMGTVAAGFSVFKNTGFFSVLNKDIAGAQKQLALFGKSFKDIKADFSTGQGLFKSLFSSSITKADVGYINDYVNLVKSGIEPSRAWSQTMENASVAGKNMAKGIQEGTVSMGSLKTATIGGKAALLGLEVAATAANIALTMGISLAIQGIVNLISGWVNANKELAESVEELTTKFQEQSKELQKLKGDYDTTDESSMISKYEKLSKGVDNLGRNVSLTADEYSEYQSIVNQIADQIPSLVSGYDSQGNALLSCKDNVEDLTAAYEKLIHAQNQEILTNTDDIEKNYANTLKDNKKKDNSFNLLQKVLNDRNLTEDDISDLLFENSNVDMRAIKDALENAGIDTGLGYIFSNKGLAKAIKNAVNSDPSKIKGIIDDYYSQFTEIVEQKKSIAQAKLSEAFDISSSISGIDYSNISEDLQAVAYQVVSSLDKDFFDKLQEKGQSVEDWTTEMLDQFNSISQKDSAEISAAFDLQTKFNGGEIPYGEYVNGLKNTGKIIDGLGLDEELKTQLKLSIGLNEKGFVEEYQKLRNRLASNEYFDIMPSDYASFIEGLSAEELSVVWKVIPELEETDYKETIEDVKSALRREMIIQGLTFDLNLEVETVGLEALNTALAESVSATGLSSDSINALKGRYSELESQGYDLSSMFEETSNGIHINRNELNKLEKAYAAQKLDEVTRDLDEMKSEYNRIGEELKTCSTEAKAGLYNDQLTLAQKISEAATLASQYEGLTSAYNDWLKAEEAGQERDMYENIIEGFENIDDEISRGWIDDGTIKFLEMLTGRTDLAGKSGKQLKEIYDGLDKTIGNSGYSIRDFFTVNEDGDSTNTGVYNFLETVESFEDKLGDVVKRKGKNIVGFDFEVAGGDEVIAETLGISKELVQIMVRAADDAGFVISLDGTYRQLADLQNEAKAAADYLKEIGKTDYEFDFNTSSIESLNTQLNEAHKILDDKKFWNKDGTFNFNADGAKQAMDIVSTLQAKLDYLTQEKYGIGLTVEDEEFEEPLENLQEYGRTVQTLNQLKLNPKVNAEEIDECETKLDELAQEFNELDTEKKLEIGLEIEKGVALTQENLDKLTDDKKIKLGFVDDDGKPLTNVVDVIQNKIESGEVTIPTVLDIQANMDKNIEKLADLAWLNSGFLTEDEEKVIKKKYNIEVEADEIDTSDVDNKVDNALNGGSSTHISSSGVVHGGGGGKFELSREANIEIVANTFGVDDVDDLSEKLKGLDDKTVEAIAKTIGKIQVDELKQSVALLKPKEVEAIANAIGKGDVAELSDIIGQLSPKTVDAIANALGYDDVNDLQIAVESMDGNTVEAVANALGLTDVETLKSAVSNMEGNTVDAKVNTDGQAEKVWNLQNVIDGLKGKDVFINIIKTTFEKIASGGKERRKQRFGSAPDKKSNVNGTAHVNGTTGIAFKQGSWGTKDSGTALVGELGRELVVRDGRYFTIGDGGAHFFQYKKGDIIFNHKQTEELFDNGKVTADGGRAKSLVNGTAFSSGTGGFGKIAIGKNSYSSKTKKETTTKTETTKTTTTKTTTTTSTTNNTKGSSANTNNAGASDKVDGTGVGKEDKFEETFDWIEIAISRIEREIDNLDKKVNSTYASWSDRNTALNKEINKVGEEIQLQSDAADKYLAKANSVGLDESYAEKIRNGTLNIEDFEGKDDEALVEKIKEYQKWYELYLKCTDEAEDLRQEEAKLYAQRFENVQSRYDGILQGFEHTETMLNEYISQAEAKGYIVSKKYYDALINNNEDTIETLKEERGKLINERNKYFDKQVEEYLSSHEDATRAQAETAIKDSQQWRDMCNDIDGVTQEIEAATTQTIEWQNAIRDIDWEVFDLIQERISDVTAEADFLVELMSNKDLFDDEGKLTEQGISTIGLDALGYNVAMYSADDYQNEIDKLDAQIASGELDGYSQDVIDRRRELVEAQREQILVAEDYKDSIKSLLEDAYAQELDALQEKIDKTNEAIDSQKD